MPPLIWCRQDRGDRIKGCRSHKPKKNSSGHSGTSFPHQEWDLGCLGEKQEFSLLDPMQRGKVCQEERQKSPFQECPAWP